MAAAVTDGRVGWMLHGSFGDVLQRFAGAVIAVDMPIGITDDTRPCDQAAQAFLRTLGASASSVFLAPTADALTQWEAGRTHAEAMAGRAGRRGVSIQAWNLVPRIVDVRDALVQRPDAVVVESHPECSFRALDPGIGGASKKTARGAGRRLRALQRCFALDLADAPDAVPLDDVLDATVLVQAAQRFADGSALVLPEGATAAPRIVI